ncbi:MAG: hypothetical protein ABR600_06065 [Actinomycetota bacterium]
MFRNADCSYSATLRHGLHYKDASGAWQDVDLSFHGDGNSGYVEDQSDVIVRVKGATVEATDRITGKGIRWITPGAPAVSGRKARFQGQGLTWRYATRTGGIKLNALVSSPIGSKTYQFPYKVLGGAAELSVDGDGNLVSDAFTIPRAVVIDADLTHYQAGAWTLLSGNRVGFSFDDSRIPASAYPYSHRPHHRVHGWRTRCRTCHERGARRRDGERQWPGVPPRRHRAFRGGR